MSGATAVLYPSQTPSTYHRIVSSTLQVPTDTQASVPVGLLACQRDPLLRTLQSHVVSCTVSKPPAEPAGKKAKKAVIAPTLPKGPILEVVLHDTIIFPEGGGQPTDTGVITTADNQEWNVLQAKRYGGHAVHFVQVKDVDIETALQTFHSGAPVTVLLDKASWNRRYDHMSMHTSQHLLSALLETQLDLPTLSWSLTAHPAPCYVEIPRGMTGEEIASIQECANRFVFEGRKVHVEVTELDKTVEQPAPTLESGRAVGKALPDDYTGGVKRIVVIDGVDRNPCCGTHLPSLHNLQLFLLPHTDTLARSATTTARLYFLAGPRLITHLTSTHTLLTNTASILSCGAPLVPERVNQVVDERRRGDKRVDALEGELARLIAADIVQKLGAAHGGAVPVLHLHRSDDSANPLGFLSAISMALSDILPNANLANGFLIVLSSSPLTQTVSSVTVVLVCGTDDKLVKTSGDALKSKLGVKGGGKGTRWSGKYTGVWKAERENIAVDEILKSVSEGRI
ncbi:hypothetical protein HGRIS_010050 [Hohenbuehelia grisea]|uniref:ThrRS/AlaRS common domain-containing protein n=1 Tax=Hohenbuehelia grisea TaxID=104357 RepID=A0ABR3J3H0_9AGAR